MYSSQNLEGPLDNQGEGRNQNRYQRQVGRDDRPSMGVQPPGGTWEGSLFALLTSLMRPLSASAWGMSAMLSAPGCEQ
jgi:hypothetical protein